MKIGFKLLIPLVFAVLAVTSVWAAPKEEPWADIEARTKFRRTKHYIEAIRVHSDVFKSAKAKGNKDVPGPFPVHVILPEDYEKSTNRRYGVVYLLGGKSGWDNGPELGGATYWSVWCKTPLTMDNLQSGRLGKEHFQENITNDELNTFNRWLTEDPYYDLIVVCLWNPPGGNTGQYERYLVDEVMPFIDAHYRTVPDRRFRGIDGACAGAAQAIMISARRPDVFAYCGGQQTDLGSYPETPNVFAQNVARIKKAGGISYNINTNTRDGCNTYSNGGRLYQMVQHMLSSGFRVTVNIFNSCSHGYCAYRYPNGHQALLWFATQFKHNFQRLGLNKDVGSGRMASATEAETNDAVGEADLLDPDDERQGPLPGLW